MKKNINLIIDGIAPEKVMYDTDNHSLVVLYPEQKEFKKGDKVRLKKNLNLEIGKWYNDVAYCKRIDDVKDAILTIDRVNESSGNIKAYNNIDGDWWMYSPEWLEHAIENEVEFKRGDIVFSNNRIMIFKDMPFYYYVLYFCNSKSIYINGIYSVPFSASTVRLATPEEQQILFDALKEEGKKWNAETLEIEDLDINEIVYNLSSACSYLNKPVPDFKSLLFTISNEDFHKYKAQITLQLICKAWNKFDGFVVDFNDKKQVKYSPRIDLDGSVACGMWWIDAHNIHSSCYSFPTQERAIQFGNQFKDLLKTAMGL